MSVVTFLGHLPVILSAKSKGSDEMKQILIVEDDSFLNKMLAYNLTADGYGVTSALNARTAAAGLSCPLDGEPYIVKIKSSFVLFKLHNITQCHFTFRVIVFERLYISYYTDYLFSYIE